ncbi:hypothetical protein [Curtobacterium sp. MCBD17_040]|uniref:hypothetical protein n=1 Tax=Curtobacterium sp. MCBD17_040 TaxID=2175674 RepID=UPI0011B583FD|nr:hypothetical protein [Curtobacterium sp. MCBD17_040]WIB64372.1 hypothetical protein DEI94_04025 [Curtobacterium sp. MCBD17_040]
MTDTVEYYWTGTANASPSVQRVNGAVARSNLLKNPAPASGTGSTTSWGGNPGNGTAAAAVTGDGTEPAGAKGFIRYKWSAAETTAGGGIYQGVGAVTAPGTTYTFSGYVRSSQSQRLYARIEWYDASNNGLGVSSGPAFDQPANYSWNRVSVTAAAPAGAVRATACIYVTTGGNASVMPAGAFLDFTAWLFEPSATVGTYFDGTAVSGTACGWNGTANASVSVKRTGPAVSTNRVLNPGFLTNISNWAVQSTASWDSTNKRGSVNLAATLAIGANAAYAIDSGTTGDARRFGLWFYNTSSTALAVSLSVTARNSSSGALTTWTGTTVSVPAGQSSWLTVSTGPTGYPSGTSTVSLAINPRTTAWPAGTTFAWTDAMDTEYGDGSTLTPDQYFDGSFAPSLVGWAGPTGTGTSAVTSTSPLLIASAGAVAEGASSVADEAAEFLASVSTDASGSVSAWGVEPRPFQINLPTLEAQIS